MTKDQLAPIGAIVKRTEGYLAYRRRTRGAGFGQREKLAKWEDEESAKRWIVQNHLAPKTEDNESFGWLYEL